MLVLGLASTTTASPAWAEFQRTSGGTEVPVQPIPVQVVPPDALNPFSGPAGTPYAQLDPGMFNQTPNPAMTLGVGAMPGLEGSSRMSEPAPTRPGFQDDSGTLPNADATVALRADDEDVRQVLALLGRQAEVNILVSPGVSGKVQIDLQDVTFRQALDAVLKLAGLGAREENGLVYVYTLAELDGLLGRERKPVVRVYHLNYIRAADLQAMIRPFVSADGTLTTTPAAAMGLGGSSAGGRGGGGGGGGAGVGTTAATPAQPTAGGGTSSGVATGGNSLAYHDVIVVRDYPENLAVIDEIVKRLDVQPPQVLIEAVILLVRLRDDQQLGVNFSIVDNLEKLAAVAGNGALINAAAGFSPARVLAAGGQLAPGYLPPAAATQGIKFGFISNNVSGFIQAVESFNKVNILASPRILVLNKQRAEIQLGQRLGFRNTVTNLTSSLQTVEFLSVGTLLTLRPFVSNDGMIRLEIHPEKSTGALDAAGIPQTNTSELTTNILVPDGATIVIGGLIDDEDDNFEEGTPGLMRLPLVGPLFRNRRTAAAKNELIVLLTPRVLRQGGLPEPRAGVAPHGVLGLPNSGPMPGPGLRPGPPPGIESPAMDSVIEGPLFGPPADYRSDVQGPGDPMPAISPPAPGELPPLPIRGSSAAPLFSPPEPEPGAALPPDAPNPDQESAIQDPADPDVAPSAGMIPVAPATMDPSTRPAGLITPAAARPPAMPPASPARPEAGWRHVVRSGEDFAGIARQYYGTPTFGRALWEANRLKVPAPDSIHPGLEIEIPPAAALDLAPAEVSALKAVEAPGAATPEPAVKQRGLFRRKRREPGSTPKPVPAGSDGGVGVVPTSLRMQSSPPDGHHGYRPGDLTRGILRNLAVGGPEQVGRASKELATENPFAGSSSPGRPEPTGSSHGYRPGDLTRAVLRRFDGRDPELILAPPPASPSVRQGGAFEGLTPLGAPVVTWPSTYQSPVPAVETIAPTPVGRRP